MARPDPRLRRHSLLVSLAAALAFAPRAIAQDREPPEDLLPEFGTIAPAAPQALRMGTGRHVYEWVHDWAKLPAGMTQLGPTHGGIVVDAKNQVYVAVNNDKVLLIFAPDGKCVGTWEKAQPEWGKQQGEHLHGLCIHKEGDQEFIYAAALGRKTAVKLTLDGKLVWEIGYPKESGIYPDPSAYNPTGIAALPDGGFVVADGYGTSWLHLYDKAGKYVKSFGGPGTEVGKFQTCHGLCVDTRGEKPLLLIADRQSSRLQHFTLTGEPVKVYDQELRLPCVPNVVDGNGDVVIPDLQGRVTIFDKDMKLVTHLGDNADPTLRGNYNVPVEKWKDGQFTAPHGGTWDHDGNLYVMDWNVVGRVTKLQRVKPAK
jgi:DNA-binding beta-propeller fold protein YncE